MSDQSNSLGRVVFGVALACSVTGITVTLLRIYCHTVLVKKAGVEDLCAIIAMILATTFTVLVKLQVDSGLGAHERSLAEDELVAIRKFIFASVICYNLCLTFVKLAILFLYLRVFYHSDIRTGIYILQAVVVLYMIEAVLLSVFLCTPVHKFWMQAVPGRCLDRRPLWLANSVINIATDFTIFLLPIPILTQLNLPSGQKRGLIFVFAFGFLTCIVSAIRLYSIVFITASEDLTYTNASAAAWSAAELNIGLICASLPALRPAITRMASHVENFRNIITLRA